MKILSVIALATVAASASAADGVVSVTTEAGRNVTVEVVNDNIVRVTNALPGETVPQSRAAVLKAAPFTGSVSNTGYYTTITTQSGVTVNINNNSGAVDINGGAGRIVSDNGLRPKADGKQYITLTTSGLGSFYGAGERGHSFDLKGDTLVMYNRQNYGYTKQDPRISQMNITMPLVISSTGYALVFDDFAVAKMIMAEPIEYISESRSPISYYFINGAGTLPGVVSELSRLTGRQELPPFWSLGYINSKYGYKTQAETLGIIDTLKQRDYPVDGVVLDLYWYGQEEDMGRLAWDKDQWPDHRKMLADLRKRGVNTVIISQPYILQNGRGVDNYNALAEAGMMVKDSVGGVEPVTIWVGHGGMFDVSNPDTRRWLADRYDQLTAEGVGGWWGDLGEPEVHPETGHHANGLTAREYHNQYGNDWSSIIYDLFKEKYPDTRLMTMMRGGTTGLQRYSVFPWSTDVSRSWGGLQPQITIMLNSGLSGLGYMSHDVGGFAVDPETPYIPELYTRWVQLGIFSPIFRTHAQQFAEPIRYPKQEELLKALVKERYRWLPYNYTLAWENASQGQPLVRSLNYYSQGSNLYDDIDDEYLWGRDVLVAPVLTAGATERQVVFPEGEWVDYANPSKVYSGGDTIQYPAPLEVLPLFVRAGAFIPTADYHMGNTLDYNPSQYTVNYYPTEGKSEYTLYDDDRTSTRSLEDGAYALLTLRGDATPDKLTIDYSISGSYKGMPAKRTITFKVFARTQTPASVTVNGKKAKWSYDTKTGIITVTAKDIANNTQIIITNR